MSSAICEDVVPVDAVEKEVIVFYVGDLLVGIDIDYVREINGNLAIAPVPIAPRHVRGVTNLRGEVLTVLDLRRILDMEPAEITPESANIVVRTEDEAVGLLVDRVDDVLKLRDTDAQRPTSNVDQIASELFESVYQLERGLLVVLNVEETIARK